jgi:hypothetical protein
LNKNNLIVIKKLYKNLKDTLSQLAYSAVKPNKPDFKKFQNDIQQYSKETSIEVNVNSFIFKLNFIL